MSLRMKNPYAIIAALLESAYSSKRGSSPTVREGFDRALCGQDARAPLLMIYL